MLTDSRLLACGNWVVFHLRADNYHIYINICTDSEDPANSEDTDRTPPLLLMELFDQRPHCLPFSQHFLDKSSGSEKNFFESKDKYGKQLRFLNI